MEHRIGRRKKINALVELWRGDLKLGEFELLNVGAGGLFLKGEMPIIHEGETFTIKSKTENRDGIVDDHLKVMAVHQSEQGVGLMWAGCDKSFYSKLERVLNHAA